MEKKVRGGSIKGVLQYESALPYRDERVWRFYNKIMFQLGVVKCNQLPYKEVASLRDEHCNMFGRKVTVWD